ncbi:MAG: hypothetical protein ACLPY5_07320 [Candidatus Bathyarchaeia archaeon]
MKRYVCLDCERKFAIPYVGRSTDSLELGWLLNEIGMLTTKLTELLSDMNERLELLLNGQPNIMTHAEQPGIVE